MGKELPFVRPNDMPFVEFLHNSDLKEPGYDQVILFQALADIEAHWRLNISDLEIRGIILLKEGIA